MNYCFLIFIILLICLGIHGFQSGLVEEVNRLVSLTAALVIAGLCIMIYMSFRQEKVQNILISVLLLVLACLLYRLLHFVIKVIQDIMEIPLLHFLNQILGLGAGVAEAVIVLWMAYTIAVAFPELETFSSVVVTNVNDNALLLQINSYNYLAQWIQSL